MHARAALLSLLLAGPALAAPPRTAPDLDRIFRLIQGADPTQTAPATLRPVADLVEAAELATAALEHAPREELGELFGHVVTARQVAYERTSNDPAQLCARIAAVEKLLRRPDLPPELVSGATRLREEDRQAVPAEACSSPGEPEPEPEPEPTPQSVAVQPSPPPVKIHKPNAAVLSGGALLGLSGATLAALVGVGVYRSSAADELNRIAAEVEAAGGKTAEQAEQARRLVGIGEVTKGALVGLGVGLGVLTAAGLGLVLHGKAKERKGPQVVPLGGPHTAGLMLHGRF